MAWPELHHPRDGQPVIHREAVGDGGGQLVQPHRVGQDAQRGRTVGQCDQEALLALDPVEVLRSPVRERT